MTESAPITIEVEPARGRRSRGAPGTRWITRTRVHERVAPPLEAATVAVAREPVILPVGYQPPPECTCLDGYCDADHANE